MESKIIKRIRNLFALSRNNNSPEEAAAAAAHAMELMQEHQIAEADLAVSEHRAPEPIVDEVVHTDQSSKVVLWRDCLAGSLADAFGCHCYTWRERKNGEREVAFHLVGPKRSIDTVRYLYGYLILEVERLCDKAWADAGRPAATSARTWKNSFRMGAVGAIDDQLARKKKEQREEIREMAKKAEETGGTCNALVLIKDEEERAAQEYKKVCREKGLVSKGYRYTTHHSAYSLGETAGKSISLESRGPGISASKQRVEA